MSAFPVEDEDSVLYSETLGYPMMKTASLCVPSFWHNTGVWWTDRQTPSYGILKVMQTDWGTVETLHAL